ncbi:MAG: Flp pilus assembly protein CpaB [Eubacterium sp.]
MKKVYLIAVIFALIAGFSTYMFAKYIDDKSTIKDADTVEVVVALQDIADNTKITQEMFEEDAGYFTKKTIIADDAAPNYVTDYNELVDKITVDPIYAGEQISSNRYEDVDGDDIALSFKLNKGMVAYSFNAASVKSVDGYISEGDTVNVIVYEKNEDGESETKVAYEDLKIIRVSNNTNNTSANSSGTPITEYSTLTVEVTEKQALQLYEIENDYDFKLILNPRS